MQSIIDKINYLLGPKTFSIVITALLIILAIFLIRKVIGKIFLLLAVVGLLGSINLNNVKNVDDFSKYVRENYGIESLDENILKALSENKDLFKSVKRELYKYESAKIESDQIIFYGKDGKEKVFKVN